MEVTSQFLPQPRSHIRLLKAVPTLYVQTENVTPSRSRRSPAERHTAAASPIKYAESRFQPPKYPHRSRDPRLSLYSLKHSTSKAAPTEQSRGPELYSNQTPVVSRVDTDSESHSVSSLQNCKRPPRCSKSRSVAMLQAAQNGPVISFMRLNIGTNFKSLRPEGLNARSERQRKDSLKVEMLPKPAVPDHYVATRKGKSGYKPRRSHKQLKSTIESDVFVSGPDEGMDLSEPDWIAHNRQWYEEHPEVSWMKFSPSALQGWVTTADPTPSEDSSEGPLNIDVLFASRPSAPARTFISNITLTEQPDLDQMGVGQLFSDESCSTPTTAASKHEERRKFWTKDEELALSALLEQYSKRVPKAAWSHISKSLCRSVTSITAKAAQIRRFGLTRSVNRNVEGEVHGKKTKLEDMIALALEHLPGKEGTKDEILSIIEQLFPNQLSETQSKAGGVRWKNSVKQLISSTCQRIPGLYRLNPGVAVSQHEKCNTMQEFIVWALSSGPGTLQDIKSRIRHSFGRCLNDTVNPDSSLCVWEKTLLKKLKNSPFVDHSQAVTRYRGSDSR